VRPPAWRGSAPGRADGATTDRKRRVTILSAAVGDYGADEEPDPAEEMLADDDDDEVGGAELDGGCVGALLGGVVVPVLLLGGELGAELGGELCAVGALLALLVPPWDAELVAVVAPTGPDTGPATCVPYGPSDPST
jgi:hypothetical protein